MGGSPSKCPELEGVEFDESGKEKSSESSSSSITEQAKKVGKTGAKSEYRTKILIGLGVSGVALLGVGLYLLIDYYMTITSKAKGDCDCVTFGNELIGAFYGLIFGAAILLGVTIYLGVKGWKTLAKFLAVIIVLFIISSIVIWYIADRIKKCNANCTDSVDEVPLKVIGGWILSITGILCFCFMSLV